MYLFYNYIFYFCFYFYFSSIFSTIYFFIYLFCHIFPRTLFFLLTLLPSFFLGFLRFSSIFNRFVLCSLGAYNPVMRYARSCINNANSGGHVDARFYLWAMRFFMEFNRNYKFHVKYVR